MVGSKPLSAEELEALRRQAKYTPCIRDHDHDDYERIRRENESCVMLSSVVSEIDRLRAELAEAKEEVEQIRKYATQYKSYSDDFQKGMIEAREEADSLRAQLAEREREVEQARAHLFTLAEPAWPAAVRREAKAAIKILSRSTPCTLAKETHDRDKHHGPFGECDRPPCADAHADAFTEWQRAEKRDFARDALLRDLVGALEKIVDGAPTDDDFQLGGKFDYDEGCGNADDVEALGAARMECAVANMVRPVLARAREMMGEGE